MTINFPLTFPDQGIGSISITADDAVSMNKSPFSLSQQVYDWGGQQWMASVSLPVMQRPQAEKVNAFLLSLRGQFGTFLLGDPMGATPQGAMSGTPLVNGGGQTGQELVLDGADSSVTDWAIAGDYIQIGTGASSRLYKVLQNADSDGSGNVTLQVYPRIVTAPADNAAIIVSNCVGLFRLSSSKRSWSVDESLIYASSFDCESVV